MDLRLVMTALRARWGVALLVLAAVVALVVVIALKAPKRYTATVSLVIDIRSTEPMAALLLPSNMATQVAIIESDPVAKRVVKLLKLDEDPTLRGRWMAETQGKGDPAVWIAALLQGGLHVKPAEVSIINISYKASDPAFAAAAANAFARAYTDTLVSLKTTPAAEYARSFAQQSTILRAEVESAQTRLSDYERRSGVVANDNRLDAETARLNQLTNQLAIVQGQIADARSRQRTGSAAAGLPSARNSGGADLDNGAIQQLRAQVDQKEVELKNAGVNLGVNHPRYRSLEAQVDELKGRLAAETRRITNNFAVAKNVGLRTQAELTSAIAAQKRKLIDLKSKRDQMDLLKADLDRAQAAYDASARRLTQTSMESRSTDTNVTVLSPAVAPTEPSFPKPLPVMLIVGVVLGAVAGIGAAVLLEMIDRRVRSPEDLADMLQLPVLGVIGRRNKRSLSLPRRPPIPLLR
jgi:succinoglycan biosynthesis transport protein ExoP